jgi:hypothetical protein
MKITNYSWSTRAHPRSRAGGVPEAEGTVGKLDPFLRRAGGRPVVLQHEPAHVPPACWPTRTTLGRTRVLTSTSSAQARWTSWTWKKVEKVVKDEARRPTGRFVGLARIKDGSCCSSSSDGNFGYVFDGQFQDLVLTRHDQNAELIAPRLCRHPDHRLLYAAPS